MKTSLMFLAALSVGTAAIAQSSSMQPGGSAGMPTSPPTTDMPSTPTDPAAQPAPPSTDASPAAMPADASGGSNMAAPAATPPSSSTAMAQPAMSDYPTCSRTVTDKCLQKGAGAGRKSHRK